MVSDLDRRKTRRLELGLARRRELLHLLQQLLFLPQPVALA
jgi:hypothetical protein